MAERNLKQRIGAGEQVIGANVGMDHTVDQLKKVVESGTFDFLWVDGQHSAFSEDRLVAFCDRADTLDADVMFRIKHTYQSYLIGNLLDLGPAGIEVPQVETESTVDEAVDFFYYPQQGVRSWGGEARRKVSEVGGDRLGYAEWWNNYGVLMIQLESIPAVTGARRLAKAGVDCLSFGPNDLMYSIEAHPHHPFRDVDDCVRHVAEQLAGSDTRVCFRNHPASMRQRYIDMGVTVFLESPGL